MAGRIPNEFIQELLSRVDVADVIGQHLPLKKAGQEYKACCPFHNEKTASFTVSPRKGFYHCFGCGAHGTALGFLMEIQHLGFLDAVEDLAQRCGMTVPHAARASSQGEALDPLYECMAAATQFYQQNLKTFAAAKQYVKSRGLTGAICKEYGIGFAPPGFDNIEAHLKGKYSRELLLKVGLLSDKEGRVYDKFRNRLMFPIRDYRGRVIAFGGRDIADGKPKYMNSPETPLFHKGATLYGLYEMQQRRGKVKYLVLTEGYMDVVSLAQGGVKNAMATLGTATTEHHIRQMTRFCRTFVFCYDGDRAGRDAAWRALEQLLPRLRDGDEVRFAHLPEGEDPDSWIKTNGAVAWKEFIGQSTPLEEYFFTHLSEGVNVKSVSGKSTLVECARPLLENITAQVFRDLMINELSSITGLTVKQLNIGEASPPEGHPPTPAPIKGRPTAVRSMMRLLLEYPTLAQQESTPSVEVLAGLGLPGCDLLAQLVQLAHDNPKITTSGLIESFRDQPAHQHLMRLMRWAPVELDQVEREKDIRGTYGTGMHRFELAYVKSELTQWSKKQMSQGLSEAELETYERLKKRRAELHNELQK